jgi:N6-adenosine-specific RNA methylase IME4
MNWEGLQPPYRTIVADPPWRYMTTSPLAAGADPASAEGNYSTMSNEELAALPVRELADRDAHLYLWVTNPRIFGERRRGEIGPYEIAEAWGFHYTTLLTWVKTGGLGMGYWFRSDTEHIMFCTRGRLPIPADQRQRNVITAPRGRHSVKPPAAFDLIERVSPGPYVELFARQPRLGWDHWGKGYELGRAAA